MFIINSTMSASTENGILIDFGGAMKRIRERKGLTQGDIFRATGLERSYLSKFENNKIPYPRFNTVARIARALDVLLPEFIREATDGALSKT